MTIEHLSFGYSKRKNRVLNDCSLRLDEGKIYGLLGKNGVGKSTLLYLMTGLLTPTEGHAYLNGTAFAPSGHIERLLPHPRRIRPSGLQPEKVRPPQRSFLSAFRP